MELLVQQLVNGLAVGSIYALIALGYTMVYGTIKLINFAHGDVYMMGAFIGYFAVMVLKMNVFVALLVAMVACAVLGVVIERVAYKRFCQRKANFDFRGYCSLNGIITIYRTLYKNGESHACGCRG